MHYVVGFLFDNSMEKVTLIRKARPKWQAGRLNGVGGAVERSDGSVFEAMVREFREETSVTFRGWWPKPFATMMTTADDRVDFFAGASSVDMERLRTPAGSDEPVVVISVRALMRADDLEVNPLPNIRWLVQMAISLTLGESSKNFTIVESPHR